MKRILTAGQMKELDERTIRYHGVDGLVLMERAALGVIRHLRGFDLRKVLVVCGSGNNGGDGIAIARILHLMKKTVFVYFVGNTDHQSESCRRQMEIASSYGVRWVNNPDYSEYTTIVDALFGVGLSRDVTGTYAEVISNINQSDAAVIAVDIPSGVCADDGKILGCAVKADLTVSFAFEKAGQVLPPGKGYCGRLVTEDIGIYGDGVSFKENYFSIEDNDLSLVPMRSEDGNKGTFGKVLLIAGAPQMPGAAVLCGQAVMRCGAGMLKVVTPYQNREIFVSAMPEAMLGLYESGDEAIFQIKEGFSWADVVVMGPGIGTGETMGKILEYVLKHCTLPLVLDADALNLVSRNKLLLKEAKAPVIVTPHMGEMSRLTGKSVSELSADRLRLLKEYVREYSVQCVLKDHVTCTALPDESIFINESGNCGMATAGSGDVLTGIIGGLLATGTSWEAAGALGAWIHGIAGDHLKEKKGAAYLMAGDLIKELVWFRLGEERGSTDE